MCRLINLIVISLLLPSILRAAEPPATPPVETFSILGSDLVAPATLHVHALKLPLDAGTCLTAGFDWDFGDVGSKYNTLRGFSAAHTFDRAGTYTVGLTLTSESGRQQRFEQRVVVRAPRGPTLYVSRAGNDRNAGDAPAAAVRSIARAMTLAGNGSRVLLRRGDKFSVPGTIRITQRNLLIGAYGLAVEGVIALPQLRVPANNPEIVYAGPRNGSPIIEVSSQALNVTVQDVTFDSIFNRDTEKKNGPSAVRPMGTNFTMRRCVLLNVCDGILANSAPTGVLMQDCVAPLPTGLRAYMAWVEGTDQAYIGNVVVNSTREAVMRVGNGGAKRVLIAHNDFTNLNRTAVDRIDTAKNALTVQYGSHIYIAENTFRVGPVIVGPLGDKDGFKQKGWTLENVVFENNSVRDFGMRVSHGVKHMIMRNNRFWCDNRAAINVEGYNSEYKRGSDDLTIINNTAINRGSKGNFIRIGGRVDGWSLLRNLYVAPKLAPGSDLTAAVYVGQRDLSGSLQIHGNIWPICRPLPYAGGGVFYIWPSWSDERGYLNLARWNELAQGTDRQADIAVNDSLWPWPQEGLSVGVGAQK